MVSVRIGCVCAAACIAVFGRVEVSSACTRAACEPPVRLQNMERVPGNLVHFEVTAEAPGEMTLRTAEGEPVPARLQTIGGDLVFAPDGPIAPDTTLILEYEHSCYSGFLGEPPPPGEFTFQTSEHLPLELQPARLYVEEYGVASPGSENQKRGFVRVRLETPSPNFAAEHLMTHELLIDGRRWRRGPLVGSTWLVGIESYCRPGFDDVQYDSCGGIFSVPTGPHTLELRTHILGQEQALPPVTLDIETRCPDANEPLPGASGTPSGTDAGTSTAATTLDDASGDVADVDTVEADSRAARGLGTCALPAAGPRSAAATNVLIVGGLFAFGRRRSRS